MAKQWFYHKDFPDGQIFERGKEPCGSVDTPDKLKKKPRKKKAQTERVNDEQRPDNH